MPRDLCHQTVCGVFGRLSEPFRRHIGRVMTVGRHIGDTVRQAV